MLVLPFPPGGNMTTVQPFAFNDSATFEQNIAAFSIELTKLDSQVGPTLVAALPLLTEATWDRAALLNDLFTALVVQNAAQGNTATIQAPPAVQPPTPAPVRWFIEGLEIEGFRGINNEGSPLALKFKPDCVSSVSAPNGVGKSSIYDALSFALMGKIPKLDRLLQAERPQEYYLNKFHPGGVGTIKLTLRPDNGSNVVPITVTRSSTGVRNVVGPAGIDAEALLSELNREFVLLDGPTFQTFIDDKALERGRSFSGLLGLSRYSALRQQLQALCNTRSFNVHFDTQGHTAKKAAAERNASNTKKVITSDYESLVKEAMVVGALAEKAQQRCHDVLLSNPVLVEHCTGKGFMEVDINACLAAVSAAEDGPKRERLTTIIRNQAQWADANKAVPTDADSLLLENFAAAREEALKTTSGEMLRELYSLSEKIISADSWPSPTLCPTCAKDDGTSVLDDVRSKLDQYNSVELSTLAVATEWATKGWSQLVELENLSVAKDETPLIRKLTRAGEAGSILAVEVKNLVAHLKILRKRANEHIDLLAAERTQLEKELPPSLVALTATVETARRLQTSWKALELAEQELAVETLRATRVARLKKLLDGANTKFAGAESAMAASRLQKVEPLCQELFKYIMYSPVVPSLQKPPGSEELGIQLSEFWGLNDVSAQALLSESYRNGFAVSVYLAAASLYGGAPRFIVLDDVTSSLDAGHQHHLVEVIRTRFARPAKMDGPQVIFLTHDTLLEKLFNKHSGSPEWSHQRLEGTARTAVLPQSGAANKVRDTTINLLHAGRIDDAAPRIRQYLEFTLHGVIDRCRIPVPIDLAFGDDKRTPGEYLSAIMAAVKLEEKAGSLILEPAQVADLQLHSASIVGNYLAHWSSGQAQAFSAPALLGVMQAIEDFQDCFKYTPTGMPKKFYASLSRR